MTRSKYRAAAVLLLLVASCVSACGDDPGTPDYSDHEGTFEPDVKYDEPDPFVPGEERLSVDLFYEGERSETISINGFRTHYFIFGLAEFGRDSYIHGMSGNRLEGEHSDSVRLVGTSFWGGGIIWDEPIDLSGWTRMFVSFKSDAASLARFDITLLSGEPDAQRSVTLDPRTYGYANDGEWHSLEIPIADVAARGFDVSSVLSPFIIGAAGGTAGDVLLVDNLYFTKY